MAIDPLKIMKDRLLSQSTTRSIKNVSVEFEIANPADGPRTITTLLPEVFLQREFSYDNDMPTTYNFVAEATYTSTVSCKVTKGLSVSIEAKATIGVAELSTKIEASLKEESETSQKIEKTLRDTFPIPITAKKRYEFDYVVFPIRVIYAVKAKVLIRGSINIAFSRETIVVYPSMRIGQHFQKFPDTGIEVIDDDTIAVPFECELASIKGEKTTYAVRSFDL